MADKKEHIERGELIDFLKREIMQCENDLADSYGDDRYEQAVDSRMTAFLEVLRCAESKPAADVVEVVRCCDCKYFETVIHSVVDEPKWFCTRMVRAFDVDPTSFCSYGERKEQP